MYTRKAACCLTQPGPPLPSWQVRKEINDWVARYRRDATFSGRPSYGNVYSAVNAMAGHLNSFGPTAPVPKKRLERMIKVGAAGSGGGQRPSLSHFCGCVACAAATALLRSIKASTRCLAPRLALRAASAHPHARLAL